MGFFRDLNINARMVFDAVFFLSASISTYYILDHFVKQISNEGAPADGAAKDSKRRANTVMAKLQQRYPTLDLTLNEYETVVLGSVVLPEDLHCGFEDVGGLDDIIDELRESVLYPLTEPELFSHFNALLQAPKGVLLYGPPGCGKTMMAKALAKESGANFINIKMSLIMDKWFGESNKLCAAIFSLALKLQPCIIFIDEIDSFLRERSSTDHEVTASLKAEFMTHWDGLTTSEHQQIMILGATNRPNDIDNAILRRMPKRFTISLPDLQQRTKILTLLLKGTPLDESNFNLNEIAQYSAGLSGSDLKEMCRSAASRAMREYIKSNFKDGKRLIQSHSSQLSDRQKLKIRPLRTNDFINTTGASSVTLPNNVVPESEDFPVD
ncbi:MSP1 putative membrane-spanning ATPase [Nadsonia fulvescens var. elongata DSM 6958]|uniref:MSP1 putative membrane-spanning ATPase n=1 Tax=Nadsonia fulvescens var. elongata DSM 6958 TaxID=857566 RepID=A0A1E3PHB6_9ASCO|nr:MSP1 putative membrane-spanning ATPase [Nadsonia fulvescens var. elongata DSM 6958]